MATAKAKIIINGQSINPYFVTIRQGSSWHHSFEIGVSTEKLESENAFTIDNSIALVGKSAEIAIEPSNFSNGDNLNFKGLVTSVQIDRSYAGENIIVLKGQSPSFLLEDGIGTRSFTKKTLKAIVNEVLKPYPKNELNPEVNPAYTTEIPYIVQYKETNFHFLNRIAAIYGEWFFYNGQSLIFGKPPKGSSVDVTLGSDLISFDYGVRVRPSKFKYQSYDYEQNKVIENSSNSIKPGWLDNYGKKALSASDAIFKSEHVNPLSFDVRDESLQKHLAKVRKSTILSDTTFFKGTSNNPSIAVGGGVGVNAVKVVGKNKSSTFIGRFRVLTVIHRLNASKDYLNEFEAIPISAAIPPGNSRIFKPEAESQIAVVKENNDPDKLGRVRVQLPWQTGSEMTPWIRIVTNYASKDRGLYFVPEIGDEVYVDFEQGNPDRPYMLGAHYHGKKKPQWADPDNNLKAIKTRSGHMILFDDKDGNEMITIVDKKNNHIILNAKDESITISAPKKMVLESTEIEINGKDISITASNKLEEKGKNVTVQAQQKIAMIRDMVAEQDSK
ncbi:MAG: type VI secretion system tip protein VgrG, partial [Bacteroidota bacterium]